MKDVRSAGLFLTAAVPYAALVRFLWFLTDDAFISFRYAKNWADGLGLRFNPGDGQPVEGFSNFLWTALMALLKLLGLNMVVLSIWISFLLGMLLLFLLHRTLQKDLNAAPGALFLGLLCAALSPAFAAWSTGGLETMLFAFLMFLAFRYLLSLPGGPKPLLAGIAAGLMALTRPEGIIWGIVLAVLAFHRCRKMRTVGLYLLVLLCLFLPYLAVRWIYFGYPLPNTYYAKSVSALLTWHRGLNYTVSFLLCFVTPLVLILASFPCLRREAPAPARYGALICAGFLCYSVFTGGDFMAMGRFMAPAVPFFAVVAAYLADRYIVKKGRAGQVLIPAAVFLVLVQLLPAFNAAPVPSPVRRLFHFRWNEPKPEKPEELALWRPKTEYDQWLQMKVNLDKFIVIGKGLKRFGNKGDSYVGAAIGAIGYHSDLFIHDMCGLVDLEVAHRTLEDPVPRRSAGHDKMVTPEDFLHRNPTFLRALVTMSRERAVAVEKDFARMLPEGYKVEIRRLPPELHGGANDLFLIMQRLKE